MNIIGPINSGTVGLATVIDNVVYVLDSYNINGTIYYFLNPNFFNNGIVNSTVPFFSIAGTPQLITFSDIINGGGLGFASDGITLVNTNVGSPVTLTQQTINEWQNALALASVPYTFQNSSGTTALVQIAMSNNQIQPLYTTTNAQNILLIPSTQFGQCSGGCCEITNQDNAIINWVCTSPNAPDDCPSETLSPTWTTMSDCTAGLAYQYCPPAATCGTSNCNGPCGEIYDECYNIDGNFYCIPNPYIFFTKTQWWKSPYFIGFVVVLLIVIIVIIIILVFIFKKL